MDKFLYILLPLLISCTSKQTEVDLQQNLCSEIIELLDELDSLKSVNGELSFLGLKLSNDSATYSMLQKVLEEYRIDTSESKKYFELIDEQDLRFNLDPNSTVYRFYWRRAFEPNDILIRISKNYSEVELVYKIIKVASASPNVKDTTELLSVTKRIISKEEWQKFESLVNKSYFWQLGPNFDYGFDGSFWTLEGATHYQNGTINYHVFSKWSPEKNDFREACEYLISLSGEDYGEIY